MDDDWGYPHDLGNHHMIILFLGDLVDKYGDREIHLTSNSGLLGTQMGFIPFNSWSKQHLVDGSNQKKSPLQPI